MIATLSLEVVLPEWWVSESWVEEEKSVEVPPPTAAAPKQARKANPASKTFITKEMARRQPTREERCCGAG